MPKPQLVDAIAAAALFLQNRYPNEPCQILGAVEGVRDSGDTELWYYVLAELHEEWELLYVFPEGDGWNVQDRGNELSWNGGIVQLMVYATRLEE